LKQSLKEGWKASISGDYAIADAFPTSHMMHQNGFRKKSLVTPLKLIHKLPLFLVVTMNEENSYEIKENWQEL